MYCKGGVNQYTRDLTGQVVIVTGGTAGIGKETARELARRGATVLVTGRDQDKGRRVVEEVRKEGAKGEVKFFKVDFKDLGEVKRFAVGFKKEYGRLDILINNAGATFSNLKRSEKGVEETMLVNHLAPTYLTYLLIPTIERTPQSRIINVSSRAHEKPVKDVQHEQTF